MFFKKILFKVGKPWRLFHCPLWSPHITRKSSGKSLLPWAIIHYKLIRSYFWIDFWLKYIKMQLKKDENCLSFKPWLNTVREELYLDYYFTFHLEYQLHQISDKFLYLSAFSVLAIKYFEWMKLLCYFWPSTIAIRNNWMMYCSVFFQPLGRRVDLEGYYKAIVAPPGIWHYYVSRLSLSFECPVTLYSTPVANSLLCG